MDLRCEEEDLCCSVETTTTSSNCTVCISEQEWEKVQRERLEKELEIARVKVLLAQMKVELLELKICEQSYACRDQAFLDPEDRAKEQAGDRSTPGTGLPVIEPTLSGPSADLG